MPLLRTARSIARLTLAWFALYLGAAVASPLLAPGGYTVSARAKGWSVVQTDDAGVPGEARGSLHCPLCVPAGAPPPSGRASATRLAAAGIRRAPGAVPMAGDRSALPPPARGPPSLA